MKRFVYLALAMLMPGMLLAAPVKKDAAKMKAAAFLQQKIAATSGRRAPQNLSLTSSEEEGSAYYVFKNGNKGFAIVAGDDRFGDVIGYSEDGVLNGAQMPEALRLTLQDYAAAVKFAQENNIEVKKGPRKAERKDIAHFVKFTWNQSGVYSQNCPSGCSTGCMAVTTAMIMAYYKYPETLPAVYNSNVTEQASAEAWSPNYNAFLSNYSYSSVGEMPRFMRHVADALNTSYSTGGSGALAGALVPAFKTFGYDPGMRTIMRDSYSQEDWDEIIYEELAAGRPVSFYGEHNQLGGHSYIADGYQASTGFFYINWGWGGTCNGWFDMGILNPFVTYFGSWAGMGYTCPPAGFTGGLNAVIGIQPKKEGTVTEEVLVLNCEDMRRNGSSIQAAIFNRTGSGYRGSIRWAVLNTDGTFTLVDGNETSYGYSDPYKYVNLNPNTLTLADGTYRLVPVCKKSDETEWNLCTGYRQRYVDVTIEGGAVTTVDVHPVRYVKVDDVCYYGTTGSSEDQYLEYILTLNNLGDDVYSNLTISAVRSDGTRVGGSSMYVGLTAGQKKTMSLFLEKGSGYKSLTNPTYEVTIKYNNETIWTGTVTDANNYANYTTYTGVDFEDYEYVDDNAYLYSTSLTGSIKIINSSYNSWSGSYSPSYYIFNGPVRITLKDENKEIVGETVQQFVVQKGAEQAYPVNFEGLKSGKKYYLTCEALTSTRSGSTYSQKVDKSYFSDFAIMVKVGIPYYTETGVLERVTPEDSGVTDLPENTAAVDFSKFDASIVNLTSISNPNCLYVFPAGATVPAELSGKNVVVGGVADKITLTDGKPVVFPVDFTATEITYARTFTNFNNGGTGGWNTIVLPFEATPTLDGANIDWFHSKNDASGRKFWLYKYTNGVGGTVYFDYASERKMQANVPYLLAVPGDKWGEKYDLHNKEFIFRGSNAAVKANVEPVIKSGEYVFNGTFAIADCKNAYKLNEDGDFFELQTENATELPFRAYFANADESTSNAARVLRVARSETDGIVQMEIDELTNENQPIYNLNGQRMQQMQRGVNIVGGKKILKK
ncbi:MAG: C10 family peptidase [Prevotella sp.]|nr:C10 family peptidase [Prevotella sp.]